MKIIGIDPALIKTGWGVILSEGSSISYIVSGTIKVNPKLAMSERLKTIRFYIKKIKFYKRYLKR